MAKCRNCGSTISRLDKEICPFCGCREPLVDDKTQDMTQIINSNMTQIKTHSRVIAAVLAFFLGFLGLHEFYIGKAKRGIITLVISLVLIAGVGLTLFFTCLHNALAFLIPYFVIEAAMIFIGVSFLTRRDLVDADGVFLE